MILPERVLGRPGAIWMRSGVAMGADHLAHLLLAARRRARPRRWPSYSGVRMHVGEDALALDLVREADHRRLGDRRVRHQRALDLGRAQAVARRR